MKNKIRRKYDINVEIPVYAESKEEAREILRKDLIDKLGRLFDFFIR